MSFIRLLKNRWLLILALVLASMLKLWLLVKNAVPFNSDEAVVALMARHILGGEKPVFFYGQAYMGSLDAWFVAAGFALFGEQVWVIRVVQLLLYLMVILTTAILGEKVFGSSQIGDLAALFLAVPAVNVTLYTTVSLGGYGEALLIGNLILLLSIQIVERLQSGEGLKLWLCLAWGYLAGIGLWAFGLSLVYSVPAGIYLLWGFWRYQKFVTNRSHWMIGFGLLIVGGLAGASPWLSYAWQNGFGQLIFELSGGAIAGVEQLPWLRRMGQHLTGFVLLGLTVILGMRPTWEVRWLALPLMPFVLFFWMSVIVYVTRLLKQRSAKLPRQLLLLGMLVFLVLAFMVSSFGADPSGRYFVPLAVPLALFAAAFIVSLQGKIGPWQWGVAGLLLLFHLWGTVQLASLYPPGITTQFYAPTQVDHRFDQALIDFLIEKGETRGYSNYWVTYPLAFLSQEKLIFIPRLPYHLDFRYTERDDRYPAYNSMVAEADRVAYITTHHPELNAYLASAFEELDIKWEEIQIGDYHVFFNLSELVRPDEIGLGKTTRP
jgi:4-amino-4-deoxy-L-arabinose transferase-like glycosyltransferase